MPTTVFNPSDLLRGKSGLLEAETPDEWVARRRSYLGGSEIASAMGVSHWRSPLALWAEKTGRLPARERGGSEAQEIGLELEDYVARKFERCASKKLRREPKELVHPDYPFLRGHLDRLVLNEDAIFEAKTTSHWQAAAWEGKDAPIDYVLQVNFYLGLSGRKIGYLAVLIGGQHFLWQQLVFDAGLYARQVEAGVKFWTEFVVPGVPPIAINDDQDILAALYPTSGPSLIRIEGAEAERIAQLVRERAEHQKSIAAGRRAVEEIDARLKQRIGEAGGLLLFQPRMRITWASQTRTVVDMEKLKVAQLYQAYSKQIELRTLRIHKTEDA